MRIGILGTPVSSGNRGVLALAESLTRLCREASPGAEVVLFGSDRGTRPFTMWPEGSPIEVPIVRWRLSPRGGLRENLAWIALMALIYRLFPWKRLRRAIARRTPWIDALEKTDLVGDVRGGDSFSDIYGLKRFLIATIPVWTVIAVKGSIVQFPQTYGPYTSGLSRLVARHLLLRSSTIIARDTRSRKVAEDIVGGRKPVELSPDVAFALHVRPPAAIEMDPPLSGEFPTGAIGLNVNGLMFNGGYSGGNMFGLALDYAAFLPELAHTLLAATTGDLVLVPHTFAPAGDPESDNDASFKLRAALPAALQSRVKIITGDYDCHQIKSIIGRCDFFIGSRMHACIGALSQGVPCVGIAYSMKFAGVFESVGMGDWVVDARSSDGPTTVRRCLELYGKRDHVRGSLTSSALLARRNLTAHFSRLLGGAQAHPSNAKQA